MDASTPTEQPNTGQPNTGQPMPELPAGPGRERRSFHRRMVRLSVTLAIIGCFVGMGWAFTLNKSPEVPLGNGIEGVEPAFGAAAVPGQTPVQVDLIFGYTGEIKIDDTALPKDEVTYEKAQAILTFTPGPGKAFGRFTNGLHVAQVVYWPVGNPNDSKVFQWSFNVV